jgi:ribonucleotide reductase alpha subunit
MSFMDIYDKMCFTVSSAGGRRGAQMGTFDVSHPDVKDFIRAKREDGRLRQFNLSLLITDGFMQAVENDGDWPLVFPITIKEQDDIDLERRRTGGLARLADQPTTSPATTAWWPARSTATSVRVTCGT